MFTLDYQLEFLIVPYPIHNYSTRDYSDTCTPITSFTSSVLNTLHAHTHTQPSCENQSLVVYIFIRILIIYNILLLHLHYTLYTQFFSPMFHTPTSLLHRFGSNIPVGSIPILFVHQLFLTTANSRTSS